MCDAQLDMFWQIFRSHQVNGVNLLAYKQLFSRDIYITAITLIIRTLWRGRLISICHVFFIISFVHFPGTARNGFLCLHTVYFRWNKMYFTCRYSGERHMQRFFSAEFYCADLGKPLRKLWIKSKNYFTFLFTYFRHLFAACSLQNAQGERENCNWVHSHQQRVGLHQQVWKQEEGICFKP